MHDIEYKAEKNAYFVFQNAAERMLAVIKISLTLSYHTQGLGERFRLYIFFGAYIFYWGWEKMYSENKLPKSKKREKSVILQFLVQNSFSLKIFSGQA